MQKPVSAANEKGMFMHAVSRKAFLVLILLTIPCAVSAHGTLETPINRVYSCFLEGPESPKSAACKAAVASRCRAVNFCTTGRA